MIVTMDGPAGSGKSTISKKIAEKYTFGYINSGSFYRAVTYIYQNYHSIMHNENVAERLNDTSSNDTSSEIIISPELINLYTEKIIPAFTWENDSILVQASALRDVSNILGLPHTDTHVLVLNTQLFTPEIDAEVALISRTEELRNSINVSIRNICAQGNWIVEGRDAGTNIFPDAEYKFYLDASLEVRAARRASQYTKNIDSKSDHAQIEEFSQSKISEKIKIRDHIDANKGKNSLLLFSTAHYIDTSNLTIEEIINKVYNIINAKNQINKDGYEMDTIDNNIDKNTTSNNGVMDNKDAVMSKNQDVASYSDFEKLLQDEDVLSRLDNDSNVQNGDLVEGVILKITQEDVFVDIGLKTEGVIPVNEFEKLPAEGDTVKAIVSKRTASSVLLSFSKAQGLSTIENIENASINKLKIKATVIEVIKGGFVAQIEKSVRGFVPISQMDTVHVTDETAPSYVGKSYDFIITQFSRKKGGLNVVLSRKKLLMEFENEQKNKFFEEKKVGDIVKGTVKNYASFGIFIDLGGFDGLLHISDVSWGKNTKLSDCAPKDKELELMVVNLDKEHFKINLSLKNLTPNPWDNIEEKYKKGDIVKGSVTKILPYGAFIHLDDGIEAFVHVSDMSWFKRVNHPKEILKIHSIVEGKILNIEKDLQRISLGLKQIEENPWDKIDTLYPRGLKISVKVAKIIKSGTIVELESGLKGYISQEDYSWNKNQSISFKEDDTIECKILDYNFKLHELKLGIKQLENNPLESNELKVGTVVDGTVTNIVDFGIFVKINNDVEGLIPKSQAYDPNEISSYDEAKHHFKIGDNVQVLIQQINVSTQRLTLSIRGIKESANKQELEKHIVDADETHNVNLGDILANSNK